jgi:sugar phosphate isomerase/epimerase
MKQAARKTATSDKRPSRPTLSKRASRSTSKPRNLKLACADFTFPLLRHDSALGLIAAMEFDGIDIGLFEGRSHLWPSREFKDIAKSARTLRKKLADVGLKPADVFLQLDAGFESYAINHPQSARRRKARDRFLQTLDYAATLGAPHVTTLPGVFFETEESPEASWQRACDELAWRVERAKQHKITFSVEAHVGSLAASPGEAERLVNSTPGLTLTLDYTHFTRLGMADSAIEPLVQYASHFHVRGAREGRLQAPFKENAIDYASVLKAMRRSGYAGYLGIEYVWIDWEHCNESDNVSETILFRDFFRAQQ